MTSKTTSPGGRCLGALCGALLSFCTTATAQTFAGTWQPIGPQSATVFSGARDIANADLMLVGTHYGGIYRSFDGGFTWQHLESQLSSAAVFTMRADPVTAGTFYAGAFERGIYRSTDAGQTWTELNNGLTNTSIVGISINPFDNQELLATNFEGVFRSNDGGATWNAPNASGAEPAISVLFSPATDGVCYVGRDQQSVIRSTDSGATWADWGTGLPSNTTVLWIAADPDDNQMIYIATDFGIYRRREGDAAWTDLNFNLPPNASINHVSFHIDGRIFIATEVGVFILEERTDTQWFNWSLHPSRFVFIRPFGTTIHVAGTELIFDVSINDGVGFADAALGIQNNFPDALASVSNGGGNSVLFAGSDLGIATVPGPTTPTPAAWTKATDLENELILELRPDPANPNIVFAGTERAGVWRTNDQGANWNQKSTGITPNTVTSISQSPAGSNRLYAGTSTGLFISEDGGQNWFLGSQVAIPSFVSAVEADQAAPDVAYFGTNFGEILSTVNGGQTFQSSFDLPNEPVVRIASARFRNVFAVTRSGRVFSSPDQGVIWEPKDQDINHPGSDLDFSQPRPWIGYLSTLGGGVYRTDSEGINWNQVNTGIDNPFLFSIVVDRADETTVYTGSIGKVFKTTNEGTNWTGLTTGLPPDGIVADLAIDASNSNRIFASILEEGIYVSEDAGATWHARATDPHFQDDDPIPLAPSHDVAGRMFSGSNLLGLFRSDDIGVSWQPSGNGISDLVRAIEVSHQDSNRVYAGTLNSGIFRSLDGGENWDNIGLLGRQIISSAINRFDDNEVYAATSTGVTATRDGGNTWRDMGQRLALVFAMASDPNDRNTIFVGGPAGSFFSSPDSGNSNVPGGTGLPIADMQALHRTTTGILFAGMGLNEGVYRSDDDGLNWNKISTGQFATERANEVLYDEPNDELFVVGDKTGLLKSNANGDSWNIIPIPGGDPVLNPVSTFRIDPLNADHFAVARFNQSGTDMSLHFSTNRGGLWTTVAPTAGLPTGSIWTIAFSPHSAGTILAAHENGIYRSTNNGTSWTHVFSLPVGVMFELMFDPNSPQTVYGADSEGGLYVSNNAGSSWSLAPTTPPNVQVSGFFEGNAGTIHAGTFSAGIISTSDNGASWSKGIDEDLAQFVANFISIDPADPRTLYVASSSQGVLKSTDRGNTWSRKNNGLGTNLTGITIIVDPLDPDTIYLGTIANGVYVSEDAAETWAPLGTNMFHEIVIALITDAADHRTVYAGVEGGGVYQIRRDPKFLNGTKDHDHDGILSLVEEFMGLDPLSPNVHPDYTTRLNKVTNQYELRWIESTTATGIIATPQWSPNLIDWYVSGDGPGGPGTGPLIVVNDLGVHPGGYRVKEAYLTAHQGTRFLRLSLDR